MARLILLCVYGVALAWIVFAPGEDAGRVTGLVHELARALGHLGVPFRVGYTVLEFAANVALFVPFGVLVPLVWVRLPWLITASCGAAASILIELVQLTIPSRVSTISDVVANTLGALLGALAVARVRRRRGPR